MTPAEVEAGNELARVVNRSREFGRLIREYMDKGEIDLYRSRRVEWRRFNKHLTPKLRLISVDAYYDEFCREPMEAEY